MKLRSIQVLRGIAACGVAAMHSVASGGVTDPGPYAIGAAGVDLFFVISGFIIATVSPGKTAAQFLTARLRRIYPIWWLSVLPWIIVASPGIATLVTSLTLWPIVGGFVLPANHPGWTLCFEMLFYAAMTLAILTRPLVPLAIFGSCLVLAPLTTSPVIDYFGNPIIFEFLMGVGIARLPLDRRVGIAGILCAVVIFALSPQHLFMSQTAIDASVSVVRLLWWGVPAAMLVYGVLCLERHFGAWCRPLLLLGNASYSIYLFHVIPIIGLTAPWPVKFLAAVSTGILAYWFIERRLILKNLAGPAEPTGTALRT